MVWLSVFGLVSFAFQKITLGFGLSFFIGGGIDCSCLRLLFVLLWFFVGFALTAVGSVVLIENGMENQSICSLNRTNTFLQYGFTQPIW